MGLEEISRQAELLAIESTITNINEHAKIHLDNMFTDPISILINSVDSKNGGRLNIDVEYKGS